MTVLPHSGWGGLFPTSVWGPKAQQPGQQPAPELRLRGLVLPGVDGAEETAILGEALVPGGGGSLGFQLVDLEAAEGAHLWGRPLSPKGAIGPAGQWEIQVQLKSILFSRAWLKQRPSHSQAWRCVHYASSPGDTPMPGFVSAGGLEGVLQWEQGKPCLTLATCHRS